MKVVGTKEVAGGKGFVRIADDDGEVLEAWTPEIETLRKAIDGKNEPPIPDGWVLRDGPRGKQLLPPKQGGRGGGYSQSKEAFDRSAESRREWQLIEEERKDRRTAAMTVWERTRGIDGLRVSDLVQEAEELYDWLRETAAVPTGTVRRTSSEEGAPHSPSSERQPVEAAQGERRVESPESAGAPEREAASTYPVDPTNCSHRFPSGAWLPWDADDRCPKCGTPKVEAVEGTAADLGPAR